MGEISDSGSRVPPQYDRILETASFDIITLWGVIEHLDEPGDIISAVPKLLKDEGILVLQTPTEDALVRRMIHARNKMTTYEEFCRINVQQPARSSHPMFFKTVGQKLSK